MRSQTPIAEITVLVVLIAVAAVWYLTQVDISTDIDTSGLSAEDGGGADDSNEVDQPLTVWAKTMQHFEGWFPGSRSYRNNNPGNLRVAGDLGTDSGGFGIFSSEQLGFQALVSDLEAKARKYPDWTITQIMNRMAPSSDNNNPNLYAQRIAAALGVTPDMEMGDL